MHVTVSIGVRGDGYEKELEMERFSCFLEWTFS